VTLRHHRYVSHRNLERPAALLLCDETGNGQRCDEKSKAFHFQSS
jgi:hypothetical protein